MYICKYNNRRFLQDPHGKDLRLELRFLGRPWVCIVRSSRGNTDMAPLRAFLVFLMVSFGLDLELPCYGQLDGSKHHSSAFRFCKSANLLAMFFYQTQATSPAVHPTKTNCLP